MQKIIREMGFREAIKMVMWKTAHQPLTSKLDLAWARNQPVFIRLGHWVCLLQLLRFVSLDYHNKVLCVINNGNLFLRVLEAESLRLGCWHDQVLMRALFQVANCYVLVYPHMVESRNGKQTVLSLTVALILFMKVPPTWPQLIPIKSQRSNFWYHHIGEEIEFQTQEFGENTNIQSVIS